MPPLQDHRFPRFHGRPIGRTRSLRYASSGRSSVHNAPQPAVFDHNYEGSSPEGVYGSYESRDGGWRKERTRAAKSGFSIPR